MKKSKSKSVSKKQNVQLVFPKGKGGVTDTLIIADKFGVNHKNVLRKLEKLIEKDVGGQLHFEPSSYLNSQNKSQKIYEMDKSNFIIFAFKFTQPKALYWQKRFVKQFEFYEDQHNQNKYNPDHIEARTSTKATTRFKTDLIKEFIPYAIAQAELIGEICGYAKKPENCYINYSAVINNNVFNIAKGLKNPRNYMTVEQLGIVEGAERLTIKTMRELMAVNMDYHDIYKEVKKKMIIYGDIYGRTPVPYIQIEQPNQLQLF